MQKCMPGTKQCLHPLNFNLDTAPRSFANGSGKSIRRWWRGFAGLNGICRAAHPCPKAEHKALKPLLPRRFFRLMVANFVNAPFPCLAAWHAVWQLEILATGKLEA